MIPLPIITLGAPPDEIGSGCANKPGPYFYFHGPTTYLACLVHRREPADARFTRLHCSTNHITLLSKASMQPIDNALLHPQQAQLMPSLCIPSSSAAPAANTAQGRKPRLRRDICYSGCVVI